MQAQKNTPEEVYLSLTRELGLDGRYAILSRIGSGGMGQVFLAEDRVLDRKVALKVLSWHIGLTEESKSRFLREAKALSTLKHPHIVRLHSFGLGNGTPYQIMDYLVGQSLASRLKGGGALSRDEFRAVFLQIASAMEHACDQGLVHRDIKPGNIFLCSQPDDSTHAVLLDFGIVRSVEGDFENNTVTATAAALGSPLYMSPEQCRGAMVDKRADIYSLGCVMFECLTGSTPFSGSSAVATMFKQMNEKPPLLNAYAGGRPVQSDLASLVMQCLEKDPASRPGTFGELIERIADDDAPHNVKYRPVKVGLRQRRLVVSAVVVVAVVLPVVASFVPAPERGEPPLPVGTSDGDSRQQTLRAHQEIDRLCRRFPNEPKETRQRLAFRICQQAKTLAKYYIDHLKDLDGAERLYSQAMPYAREQDSLHQAVAELYLLLSELSANRARGAAGDLRAFAYERSRKLANQAVAEAILSDSYKMRIQSRIQRTELLLETNRIEESQQSFLDLMRAWSEVTAPDAQEKTSRRMGEFFDKYYILATKYLDPAPAEQGVIAKVLIDVCDELERRDFTEGFDDRVSCALKWLDRAEHSGAKVEERYKQRLKALQNRRSRS
ncbi:MAG: serine/threonine protein kinase [Candidatus Obscuribacterales bacterium]|nr:serine/threonine protein kinase [Candidatus Obscuribacterales bacterium]